MILSISAVTGCCVDTRFRGSMHASTVMIDNHHDVLQRQMMKPMPLTLHQLLSSVRKYSHCWQTCRVRKAFVYVTIRIVSLTLSYIASLPLSHIDCLPLLCFHLSLCPTPHLPPSLPPFLPSSWSNTPIEVYTVYRGICFKWTAFCKKVALNIRHNLDAKT